MTAICHVVMCPRKKFYPHIIMIRDFVIQSPQGSDQRETIFLCGFIFHSLLNSQV